MSEEFEGLLARAEDVLEKYFLAEEAGEEFDVKQACGDDAELQRLVEHLLDQDSRFGGLFLSQEGKRNEEVLASELRSAGLSTTHLGEYRIVRCIGRGGMGTVFLAIQDSLNRSVALKVLRAGVVPNQVALLRFQREAEVASSLRHPNIVELHGVGEDQGRAYIAMQFLSGPSLAEMTLPLDPARVASIGRAIAGALHAAHLAGVVHRDVKPANILLDDTTPFLVDFGLARSQTDTTLTREGNVLGTLPYVAPECLQGDHLRLDPRADVYGLGATLYELLTGRPPFTGSHPAQILHEIARKEVPALSLPSGFRDLEIVVRRCLEKDPAHRIASAGFLESELRAIEEQRPIQSRPTGIFEQAIRFARRNRAVSGVSALGLAVALPLGGVLVASRAAQNRIEDETRVNAREALQDGRAYEAQRLLAPISAASSRTEIASLAREIEAELALEAVLEATLGRNSQQDSSRLAALVHQLDEKSGRAKAPGLAASAVALLQWMSGDLEGAREELALAEDAGTSPRLLAAAQQLLEGSAFDGALPTADSTTPDERALIATCLRYLKAPLELQVKEIERALAEDPGHFQARFALALNYYFAGETRRAVDILSGLCNEEQRPIVRSYLIAAKERCGDYAGARALLDSVPESEWSVHETRVDLQLLARTATAEAIEERLAEHRASLQARGLPESSTLLRFEAQLQYSKLGDWDAAADLFSLAADKAQDSLALEYVLSDRFRFDADRAFDDLPDGPRARYDHLLELVKEGERLLGELTLREPVGIVEWKLGRALLLSAQIARGFELLEHSIELLPHRTEPTIVFADFAIDFASAMKSRPDDDGFPVGLSKHVARRAWCVTDAMLSRIEAGDLHVPDAIRGVVFRSYWNAARMARDWKGMLARYDAYSPLLEDSELDSFQVELEEAGRLLHDYYDQ